MVNLDRIEEIIAQVEIGFFLTTVNEKTHGRPLATLAMEADGSLWFIIKSGTGLENDVMTNPKVSISYNDFYSSKYLLVNGVAQIIKDDIRKKELWHPRLTEWTGCQMEDERLMIMKVIIHDAECWNSGIKKMEEGTLENQNVVPFQPVYGSGEQNKYKKSQ